MSVTSKSLVHSVFVIASLATSAVANAQTMQSASKFTPEKGNDTSNASIRVFVDGSAKSWLTQKDAPTVSAGSIGVTYSSSALSISALLNIVGSSTPVATGFGTSLLAPGAGGGASAGLLEARWYSFKSNSFCGTGGWRLYASVSSGEWKDTMDTKGAVYGVATPGMGIGIHCTPVSYHDDGDKDLKDASLGFDLGLATRGIAGNLALKSSKPAREHLLLSDAVRWYGVEGGVNVRVNGLKAALTYYWFPSQVPGFGSGQVIAGFSVESPLYTRLLKR